MPSNPQARRSPPPSSGRSAPRNGRFHFAQLLASTICTGSMISRGIVSPRRWRTRGLGRDGAHRHGVEIHRGEHPPGRDRRNRLGNGVDADHQRPAGSARRGASASSTPSAMTSLAHRTASMPRKLSAARQERRAGDVALVVAAQRRPHPDVGTVRERRLKALEPLAARRRRRRPLEDRDFAAPGQPGEQIARDVPSPARGRPSRRSTGAARRSCG